MSKYSEKKSNFKKTIYILNALIFLSIGFLLEIKGKEIVYYFTNEKVKYYVDGKIKEDKIYKVYKTLKKKIEDKCIFNICLLQTKEDKIYKKELDLLENYVKKKILLLKFIIVFLLVSAAFLLRTGIKFSVKDVFENKEIEEKPLEEVGSGVILNFNYLDKNFIDVEKLRELFKISIIEDKKTVIFPSEKEIEENIKKLTNDFRKFLIYFDFLDEKKDKEKIKKFLELIKIIYLHSLSSLYGNIPVSLISSLVYEKWAKIALSYYIFNKKIISKEKDATLFILALYLYRKYRNDFVKEIIEKYSSCYIDDALLPEYNKDLGEFNEN